MRELWDGYPYWSEEKEQAEQDAEAIRIIACPHKSCVRMKKCKAAWPSKSTCLVPDPLSEEKWPLHKAVLYFSLKRSVAEHDADPEAAHIADKERAVTAARRKALAWERAKEWLKAKRAKPEP